MPNTKEGAEKARRTLLERLGSEEALKEYYRNIGRMGGAKSRGGGFASEKVGNDGLTGAQRARLAGKKGGRATHISNEVSDEAKKKIHNILEKHK